MVAVVFGNFESWILGPGILLFAELQSVKKRKILPDQIPESLLSLGPVVLLFGKLRSV